MISSRPSLASAFLRRREQRPNIDVEAEVRERGGNHFLTAIVAVLTDLGDENARAPAFVILELADELLHAFDRVGHVADLSLVDPRNRLDLRAVAPEHLLQGERDLPDRGLGARRIDCELEQIAIA